MLILSRKPDEEFRFPQLGITVRVISAKGRRIRLGIEAPDGVDILRGELPEAGDESQRWALLERHLLANCLNSAKLGFHLAERQYALGKSEEAAASLRDALDALTRLEDSARSAADEGVSSAGKHVLLVEDDANECRLLAGILEMEGYRVTTAGTGKEALARLTERTPDFILLDMMLPELNGVQTIERIRSEDSYSDLKVFSVSGTSPSKYGVPIGPGGVDAWFPKPLDPADMLGKLRRFTGSAA